MRFGWVLLAINVAPGALLLLQNIGWAPTIFSQVEVSWTYTSWLSQASLSYIFLDLLIPRFSIVAALVAIECLVILFTLGSVYGHYMVWRDFIIVYVDEAAAFEPDYLRVILTTHSSYALGFFVFWLDYWGNPVPSNKS